jgi:hypothetical protein
MTNRERLLAEILEFMERVQQILDEEYELGKLHGMQEGTTAAVQQFLSDMNALTKPKSVE